MKFIPIQNKSRPLSQTIRAGYAVSFIDRLRGLMFRSSIAESEGLVLVQRRDSVLDSSIHMMFVPFDLAVVWVAERGEVVDVQLARSWRPAYFPRRPARYVLELHASRLGDFQIGDQVILGAPA